MNIWPIFIKNRGMLMKNGNVCSECGKTHQLPTYRTICQYCQKGKLEKEVIKTSGHVTQCLECKAKGRV